MKVCCYAEKPMEKGLFLHYPTKAVKAEMSIYLSGRKEKVNGYMTVTLDKPYKSRTRGRKSKQFILELRCDSNETGEEPKVTKNDLKGKGYCKRLSVYVSKLQAKNKNE